MVLVYEITVLPSWEVRLSSRVLWICLHVPNSKYDVPDIKGFEPNTDCVKTQS